jgi:hypothetical protein
MTVTTASKSESSSASASSKKTSDSLRSLKLRGYVGFDKIADQQVNKITKSGYVFGMFFFLLDLFLDLFESKWLFEYRIR